MRSVNPIIRTGMIMALAVIASACTHAHRMEDSSTGAVNNGFYDGVIDYYSGSLNHLSAVRRGGCPMHPSCSQYSRNAVKRYGFVTGWIMTMDRLLRCGRDELKTAPRVFVNGDWKYYDPVDQNRAGGQSQNRPLSEQVARYTQQQEPFPRVETQNPHDSLNDRLLPPSYSVDRSTK